MNFFELETLLDKVLNNEIPNIEAHEFTIYDITSSKVFWGKCDEDSQPILRDPARKSGKLYSMRDVIAKNFTAAELLKATFVVSFSHSITTTIDKFNVSTMEISQVSNY